MRAHLAGTGRASAGLEEALQRDPDNGLVRGLLACRSAGRLTDARLRQEMVRAQTQTADAQQRSLVHALNLYAHRHYEATASHLVVHLAQFPGDVLTVPLTAAFELSEDAEYLACGYRLVEQQYALAGEESWPWAGRLAGVRAEQQRIEEADQLARHALALEPRSGTAVHALAHAQHEQGRGPDYLAFIDQWLAKDPAMSQRRHLQWHAALQALAAGDVDEARRRADTELAYEDVGMRSAVNWRLLLAGQTPARLVEAEHARTLLRSPGGQVSVFHTFQLCLALAVVGDTAWLEHLAQAAATDDRADYREILAPVVQALAHITAGRPGRAVDLLERLGDQMSRIGGVRVEREIIQDTLARALIDAGQPDRAAHLLHHRRTTRGHHAYEDLLLMSGAGRTVTARPHAHQPSPGRCAG